MKFTTFSTECATRIASPPGLSFVAALFVTACASSPPVEHPDLGADLPRTWTTATEACTDIEEKWWRTFDDAWLDSLVTEAIAHNRELQAAAMRVLATDAQSRIAGADALPQIGAQFDGVREKRNFIGLPIPGGGDVLTTRSTTFGLTLAFDWELDVWGRLRAATAAAIADREAIEHDLQAAHLSLVGQVAKLWFALRETQRQLVLAEATAASFRTTAEQVRDRYERGLRPSLDLRFALSNVASAEAVEHARAGDLDRFVRQLEVLLGRYPARELQAVREAVNRELPAVPITIPGGLPAELLWRRPDLAAAERRLAALQANVKSARAGLYPRFSLTASGGTSSDELKDLVNGDFSVWGLAGNVLQPVFQGGRLVAAVDVAEARREEARLVYIQQALTAFSEVEMALAVERTLMAREAALRSAVEQSVAGRELAEERYARGIDDFITVLEAQRRAFVSESELLVARRLRLQTRVHLHLALGGGFDSRAQDRGEGD